MEPIEMCQHRYAAWIRKLCAGLAHWTAPYAIKPPVPGIVKVSVEESVEAFLKQHAADEIHRAELLRYAREKCRFANYEMNAELWGRATNALVQT